MKKFRYFLLTKSIGIYLNILSYINPKKAIKISYKLFSNPRKGKIRKGEIPTFLENAIFETIKIEDYSLQTYLWKGNQTKILLVHGWESNTTRWEKLFPYLTQENATIIALDAPAHGLSSGKEFNIPVYAKFIQSVIERFQPTIIVAHSIGGASAIYNLHLYKNHFIEKLILLGAPSKLETLIENYAQLLGLNQRNINFLEDYYKTNFNTTFQDFSSGNFAKSISNHGLIFHDQHDPIVSYSEGLHISENWKNAKLITTKNLGHSMHDEQVYTQIAHYIFMNHHVNSSDKILA